MLIEKNKPVYEETPYLYPRRLSARARPHPDASRRARVLQQDGPLLVIQPLVGIGDMVWHKPWIDQLIETQDVYLVTKMASHPQVLFSTTLPKQKIIAFDRNIRGVKGRHDGPRLVALSKGF